MKIVLVGVGGAGVSGLAYSLKDLGYKNLIGIDGSQSEITDKLLAYGIDVVIGHGVYQVVAGDIVIYSEAVKSSPEVQEALRIAEAGGGKYPFPLSYFQMVGEISKHFKTLAVAGTNGKSSTTAMAIKVAHETLPRFGLGIVGAMMPDFGGKSIVLNIHHLDDLKAIFDHILWGDSHFDHNLYKKYIFIIEACEFNRHFLLLDVDDAIITNVNLDHSDVYPTFASYLETFQQFAQGVKGTIFLLEDQKHDLGSSRIQYVKKHHFQFQTVFGEHQHTNASLVKALCMHQGIEEVQIESSLVSFKGIRRRMEVLGYNANGAMIVSDYGHHPDSLEVVYKAFREQYPDKKISAFFQPHQARRVLEFWESFRQVLQKFDTTYVYSIYAARESLEDLKKVFSQHHLEDIDSFDALGKLFVQDIATYITDQNQILELLEQATQEEIVIIFTAGNLDYEVRKWIQKMSNPIS